MTWRAHGNWQIRAVDDVLVYRVSGAWNEEGALGYCRDASREAKTLAGSRWAVLGDLRDWQLATSETLPYGHLVSEQSRDAGCVLQCLCVGETELTRACVDGMVPADLEGMARRLVDTPDQAADVLAAEGFAAVAARLREQGFDGLLAGVTGGNRSAVR